MYNEMGHSVPAQRSYKSDLFVETILYQTFAENCSYVGKQQSMSGVSKDPCIGQVKLCNPSF